MSTRRVFAWIKDERHIIYFEYGVLALAVMLPLLLPGFILTLDMVFVPNMPFPDGLSNTWPLEVLVWLFNLVLPADVIQKIIMFAILILSGAGMHRFVSSTTVHEQVGAAYLKWGAYFGGIFYMINPFTYSRFMAGQYLVLLGYALLPFFLYSLLRFLQKPDWRSSFLLAVWVTLIGMVSIHSVGLVAVLVVAGVLLSVWRYRRQAKRLIAIAKFGGVSILIFLAASSYWLIPLLLSKGSTAGAIGQFTAGDQQAFATLGQNIADQLLNIVLLQGFWAEGRGLYSLPQDTGAWEIGILGMWLLVIFGVIQYWRRGKRFVVLLLVGSAAMGSLLAMGFSGWLANYLPLFAGYREPHKFVALVALAYAALAGQGATAILHYYQQHGHAMLRTIAAILLILLPVAITPNMFWGFGGQLKPRHYPADWFIVNEQLTRDHTEFKVLFLPWHLYMYYGFAERIIASPADKFFDKPIVSSNELEFGNASPTEPDEQKKLLSRRILPQATHGSHLGARLAPLHIKYILLSKEDDYKIYSYLDRQLDIRLLGETPTLRLYQNMAYGKD